MPPQTHVVLRGIAEIKIPDARHAPAVHDAVSRAFREVVPALIQGRCDALSRPDVIHRVGTVEIDLGRIALAQLADALEARVPGSLEAAIRRAEEAAGGGKVTRADSHLELVEHFVRTGALPWWSDHAGTDVLAGSLRALCRETPPGLVPALRRWAQEPPALRRLVHASADGELHALLRVLRSDAAEPLGVLVESRALIRAGHPQRVRHEVWQSVLGVAAGAPSTPDALVREAIRQIGEALGLTAQDLANALSSHESLARHLEPDRTRPHRADDPPGPPEHFRDPGSPLAGLLAAVEPWLVRCPAVRRAGWDALRPDFEPDGLRRWLVAALEEGIPLHRPLRSWLARFDQDRRSPPQLLAAVQNALASARTHQAEDLRPVPPVPRPRGEETLYVDNAGLVILWPFLPPFFTRLGLLDEKRFVDEAAPHRAAALLQFLLTWEREPPLEYLLPLNKVLCGLAPDALFEPGPSVSDEEAAECGLFLAAVIERAPILQNMSLPGFRGTFLARQGQLSARDGAWLLRVERKTYDVVLDQFPWNFQWVRLPWMSAPMFVEW